MPVTTNETKYQSSPPSFILTSTRVLYNIYQIKTKILQKPPKNMIKYRKSTWLRHPRKELAALALKPGRAKALRHQLRMF
uniref:Uncharacterized protein n=1 Tax=Aegilops tauschii subsp. strangulata TaxID=200361 RepID=A0A453NL01_AEGTS